MWEKTSRRTGVTGRNGVEVEMQPDSWLGESFSAFEEHRQGGVGRQLELLAVDENTRSKLRAQARMSVGG